MGLLDFAANFGKKLFGDDDDAGEKIESHIKAANPGISGLKAQYKDGTVALSGKAESAEAMEKAVLMAGNVKGVSQVTIDDLESPTPAASVEYYTIVKGDTLSGIAKKFYGNAMAYSKLFDANREVIKDPNLIYPGQKIRIPPKG
ncbi:MAG: peptidoglycan-binding protein LysM [Gammaproteobacteria bacterium]|nr:peptidoglycan-binding protein LysM [Gammaproteobacteria bacterium]